MPVEIVDETGVPAALVTLAEAAASAVLGAISREDSDLCVVLCDDSRMRELNHEWRGKDSTTDVLSFSQIEGEPMPGSMLGDVVVSIETMRRQAADGGWSEGEELVRLLLHGMLHLVGFDHEDESDARVMRSEEGRIVALLAARGIACAWEEGAA
jgi:probable rRNA maturation factor